MRACPRRPATGLRRPTPHMLAAALSLILATLAAAENLSETLQQEPHTDAKSAETGASDPSASQCTLRPGPKHTATRVIDVETVLLDDGKELRLAGILGPRARDAGASPGAWPAEEAAKAALAALVLGKEIELAYSKRSTDRYGRHIAHAFLDTAGSRTWVQGALLGAGHARAAALPGDGACFAELLAHERLARDARAGLWTLPLYGAQSAARTRQLLAARSSFQIVRGKITGISETRSAFFLNFGDDWKSDFTVRVPRRALKHDAALAGRLKALEGQWFEVRGWIERRNGPMISIENPSEIAAPDGIAMSQGSEPGGAEPGSDVARQRNAGHRRGPAESAASGEAAPDSEQKQNRPEAVAPGDLDL